MVGEVASADSRLQREQPQLKSIGARPTWGELMAAVEELRGLAWKQMRGKRGDWGRDLVW
jgi:hypothetical protein